MRPTGQKGREDPKKNVGKGTIEKPKPEESKPEQEINVVDKPEEVTDPTKPEEPVKPEKPLTIKELYEKYQAEAVTRASRTGTKKFSMDDIRVKLVTIFNEIGQNRLLLSAVVKLITDSDDKFSELKYQEVRSCVQSKKTKEFDLVNEDNNSWIIKVTAVATTPATTTV